MVLCCVVLCYHVHVERSVQKGLEVALEGLIENARLTVLKENDDRCNYMVGQEGVCVFEG